MKKRLYISNNEAEFFASNKMLCSNNPPTQGDFIVGDIVISNKQLDGIFGWVCIEAGSPGKWEVIVDLSIIEEAIKNLEEYDKIVEQNINTIQTKLISLKEQALQANSEQIEALDKLNDKVNTNTNNLISINKNIENIVNNAVETEDEINQAIKIININVQNNTTDITNIGEQVEKNVLDIDRIDEQLTVNTENLDITMENVLNHEEKILVLEEQVNTNTDDIGELQDDVLVKDTEIKQLENKVIILQENDSNIDLSLFATKDMVVEINKKIELINYNIEEIENSTGALGNEIDDVETRLNLIEENIEEEYQNIGDILDDIKSDITDNKTEITILTTNLNNLNKRVAELEQLVENDIDSIGDLRTQFASALIKKGVSVSVTSDWYSLFSGLIGLIETGWCTEKDSNGSLVDCTSISISNVSTTMNVGGTQTATITVSPSNCGYSATLISSNSNIISVNGNTITAVNPGTATITASAGTKTYSMEINVYATCTGLSLSSTEITVEVGDTSAIYSMVSPSNCTDSVVWSSSNTSIATVSNGYITGVSGGSCVIIATCGSKTARCSVTVTATCTSLSMSASQVVIEKGDDVTLVPSIQPTYCTDTVNYVSGDESIAVVTKDLNNNVCITGINGGSCYVIATCGSKTARIYVTVVIKTTALALNETTLAINKSTTNSYKLGYTITPSDSTESIVWNSSNKSVATVASDGTITVVGAGSCTISVSSGAYAAKCVVTVNSPCVGLAFTSASIHVGRNSEIDMNNYLITTPSDCTDKISWYLDDYNIATIASSGKLTTYAATGSFHVQAQCGGYAATVTVYIY